MGEFFKVWVLNVHYYGGDGITSIEAICEFMILYGE